MNSPKQFIQTIVNSTVRYQNEIINRLKLYVFATSAINSYTKTKYHNLEGYDFGTFNTKFSLVDFKKDKPVKSINYKDIVDTGNKLLENELADSIFILNASAFETWILDILKQRYLSDNNLVYSDISKTRRDNDNQGKIDIILLKEATSLTELWERIIDKHLRNVANDSITSIIKRTLKIYTIPEKNILKTNLDNINEMYLCRNAIIHNQKIIGEEYCSKAGQNPRFQLGQKIIISSDMLFEQADNMLKFMQDFRKNIIH